MRLLGRRSGETTTRRLVWQASSLLLAYPDAGQPGRLGAVDRILGHLSPEHRDPLAATTSYLRETEPFEAAARYVETFDLRRKTTLFLTYWTDGDTRNRGEAILSFARAYRSVGVEPPEGESPDHLAVVLEFAATVDADVGYRLLRANRVPIGMLAAALTESESPYACVLAAIGLTLPAATEREQAHAQELAIAGPPAEAVGLQPFTLTVPPRRTDVTGIPRREGAR
ncbi:nitrate reductase molybdenum cofactor assembly chaperone [Rhodococcus maanshanensis]|uniref:Nitrate reductase delta subunit n=1 Tax=Rhodococcus maanshanensis TaxID=183556 RepID=A0A1H7G6C3_9NOCA|nr:nitrate reductase molybdenum cofactor assembly chaperone [Rhodococcus maanshanensis]SEK33624.1 nitrate reductase delta subunit [Rhodococcus maanshanensis]